VCNLLGLVTVFYIRTQKIPFVNHWIYSSNFKKILRQYKPSIIFQHNFRWMDNQYLYYWASKLLPACAVVVYTNGQLRMTDDRAIYKEARKKAVRYLSDTFRLPQRVIWYLLGIKRIVKSALDIYLMPFLLLGKSFLPLREFFQIKENPNFDFLLVYHAFEKERVAGQRRVDGRVIVIQHPVETCGEACNRMLYGLEQERLVTILPSMIGHRSFQEERAALDKWIQAISILRDKFVGFDIILKLHPGTKSNPDLSYTTEYLKKMIPELTIIDPEEKAEKWILKSRVVVGDVSTTLWFADFLKNKIVVSFDMKDFVGSDDMKYHERIFCFDSLEKHRDCDFRRAVLCSERQQRSPERKLPTLLEFLACLEKGGSFPDLK